MRILCGCDVLIGLLLLLKKTLNASRPSEHPSIRGEKICLKKTLNASRPSEHPPVRGENVKTFRWDHNRLQIENLFMAGI